MKKINKDIIKKLYFPLKRSRKYDNGVMLFLGGSKKFHGAPWFVIEVASKILDLVFYSSVPENNRLMQKIQAKNPCFVPIPRKEVFEVIKETDAILMGPGMGVSKDTKQLANLILRKYPEKKYVLDADALRVVNLKFLNKNVIITPHYREFKFLFGKKTNHENAKKMAKKYGCIIVLKGQKDIICSPKQCVYNTTGNQGMTKGGTGDVLAGLTVALACKNDLFLSACAGTLINGLAGDSLYKKVGVYYNALDLVNEIPRILSFLRSKNL